MPTVNNPYVNPVDLNNTAPKVHASQHRQGGSDPLTPADIGAAAENHTHEVSGLTVAWEEVTNKPAMFPAVQHAATHGSGGGDPLAIDASQITTGTVPLARLPHGCMERLVIVQDDTARYALTTADVQQGDTVKVVETSTMYFVVDETKLDSPDGYVAYTAGAASAVDWSAITGKPATFPAAAPSWNDIVGKPNMFAYKGVPFIVETPKTTPFDVTGGISYEQTVTLAAVNGYVLDSPLVISVSITDSYPSQTKTFTLSAGGVSSQRDGPGVLTLSVPPGRKITDVKLSCSGASMGNVSYTCSGSLQTSVLSFAEF